MNNVSAELLGGIVYASDAHLVWEDLRERFDKVNRVRNFQLHREIATLSQGTNSVSVYFSRIKELWHEYDVLVPFSDCGCRKARDHVEQMHQQRVMQFLSGLNDSYDQSRRQILMKTNAPNLNQTYAMIIQDESQQSIGATVLLDKMDPIAMQAGRVQGFKGKKQFPQCEHCGMKGHTKENCYKIIGYPIDFKPKKKFGTGNSDG
nr:uncharacterized protein LOC117278866 [Nicotiana tomentosiformis]XP_033514193.1 uncharacterized protein LOC117278866 [Nicotiana tomentosiformis]